MTIQSVQSVSSLSRHCMRREPMINMVRDMIEKTPRTEQYGLTDTVEALVFEMPAKLASKALG